MATPKRTPRRRTMRAAAAPLDEIQKLELAEEEKNDGIVNEHLSTLVIKKSKRQVAEEIMAKIQETTDYIHGEVTGKDKNLKVTFTYQDQDSGEWRTENLATFNLPEIISTQRKAISPHEIRGEYMYNYDNIVDVLNKRLVKKGFQGNIPYLFNEVEVPKVVAPPVQEELNVVQTPRSHHSRMESSVLPTPRSHMIPSRAETPVTPQRHKREQKVFEAPNKQHLMAQIIEDFVKENDLPLNRDYSVSINVNEAIIGIQPRGKNYHSKIHLGRFIELIDDGEYQPDDEYALKKYKVNMDGILTLLRQKLREPSTPNKMPSTRSIFRENDGNIIGSSNPDDRTPDDVERTMLEGGIVTQLELAGNAAQINLLQMVNGRPEIVGSAKIKEDQRQFNQRKMDLETKIKVLREQIKQAIKEQDRIAKAIEVEESKGNTPTDLYAAQDQIDVAGLQEELDKVVDELVNLLRQNLKNVSKSIIDMHTKGQRSFKPKIASVKDRLKLI